jgi:CheY-like chemotaxis protein
MSLRILVVDDNHDSADSLADVLKLDGYDVWPRYGGPEAIETALEFRPSVMIVDLVMPELNGFQVAERLRARPELTGTHFIAISGLEEQTHLDEASKVQFDDYLVKPPDLHVLRAILAELAGRPTPK